MTDPSPQWTCQHRNICWSILASARNELCISLQTSVASSYALLQKYHFSGTYRDCDLYLLIIAALFSGCKVSNEYRELNVIFVATRNCVRKLMSCCCRKCPLDLLGKLNIKAEDLTDQEANKIYSLEIDLLTAIGWDLPIDQPFLYLQSLLDRELACVPCPNEKRQISDSITTACCLLMKCGEYPQIPSKTAVAAAIGVAHRKYKLPQGLWEWMENMRSGDPQGFELAVAVLSRDSCRCVSSVRKVLG